MSETQNELHVEFDGRLLSGTFDVTRSRYKPVLRVYCEWGTGYREMETEDDLPAQAMKLFKEVIRDNYTSRQQLDPRLPPQRQ